MKKIIFGLSAMAIVAAVAVGATTAFFSDTETSTGNTFTAGAIDLTVDNHAWYNGLECRTIDDSGNSVWHWNGASDLDGVPGGTTGDSYLDTLVGKECASSWSLSDLTGQLFFNFSDLKPGDWEEDTISLHVNNNDAWLCAATRITKNGDEDITEPESDDDSSPVAFDPWTGELGKELEFVFWADDGDNVFEDDEHIVLSGTPADLPSGDDNQGVVYPIADSSFSIYGNGPVSGDKTMFIGKAFCYGDLTADKETQVPQDGEAGTNNPFSNPGFTCDGALVDNASQTDVVMGDMMFYAVQSRNNSEFECKRDWSPSWSSQSGI